jgi:peptide/nickel transport system substrate-binding protein
MITRRTALTILAAGALPGRLAAQGLEPAVLAAAVQAGDLPPMAARLPAEPRVMDLPAMGRLTGRPGGTLRMLVGGQRDVRLMPIYGYARLVGYDADLNLVPDVAREVTVEDARIYTFHLRKGHRWSDGEPFTAEDFRYVWEDMIHNDELYRGGMPPDLLADGQPCTFEVIDDHTVRYSWPAPLPDFLPKLASPAPIILYAPGHYMRQFHARYQTPEKLAELMKANKADDWSGLHIKMSRQNRPENPDLPTLEPWRPRTKPPAERFVFERNPYFHRVDPAGQQLPYIDTVELNVASAEVIAAKTATGESDLQAQGVGFGDYTLLKHAEAQHPVRVALWQRTQGSAVTLCPNLNAADPVWRAAFRDVRVRRALSVAIDRDEINKVLFYGLARPSADTVLPQSVLFRPEYAQAWAQHDPALAGQLLDEAGLTRRRRKGPRHLPDGRELGIIVETAGENAIEVDVLQLIADHWREIGVRLYIRTSQRDIFRNRALAGGVLMGVWTGIDNAVPTPDMAPEDLAPTNGEQLQWPVWGLWYGSAQSSGEPPDLPEAQQLVRLLLDWRKSTDRQTREAIWHRMLAIRAEQVFTIGTVNGALQPVLASAALRNLPDKALWGFTPTSYFGAYNPDTFYLDPEAPA